MQNKLQQLKIIISAFNFNMGSYNKHREKGLSNYKIKNMKPKTLFSLSMLLTILSVNTVSAQEFQPGKNRITFKSGGLALAGHLYLPSGFDKNKKYPAVIFDGPQTGLKDQVAGLYAQKIAEAGYITLAYDHRFYGESEGMPRQFEAPSKKVEDNNSAMDYITSLAFVDKDKVGGIGICAGGGLMAKTVAENNRYKIFIGIAAYYNDSTKYTNWFGGADGLKKMIANAATARKKFETTGEVDYMPAVWSDASERKAAMSGMEATNEPFAYYGTKRGYSPYYINRMAVQSYEDMLQFDVMASAPLIIAPSLIIHGKTDLYCSPSGAEKFYGQLTGTKDFFWIETTNHIDLYDQEQYVSQAVNKAVSWLNKYLPLNN